MTIWFAKPNAAFHAYEQSLMRPIARPAPRDTPGLWQRAKEMFGAVMDKARTIADLARRWRLTRAERREIILRLKPVEKLTRQLIVAEAATLLLMTPEGMKMRREARVIALPVRTPPKPPPPRGAMITGSRTIAVFDPHTLAVLRPGARAPAIVATPTDPKTPTTRRCAFKVMHWVHPDDDTPPPKKKPISRPRPRAFSYEDIVAFTPKPRKPERDNGAGPCISRRIEALSRVLAKPERAIRRIARFFASLPREALEPFAPPWIATRAWYHGHNEFHAANQLADRAFIAFIRARIRDFDGPEPEPG